MTRVFISYSSKDREFVVDLARDLQRQGIQLWLDQWHIMGRLPYWTEIEAGIEACSHLLFVVSPDSIDLDCGARDELAHARHHRKQLVVIMVRPVDYNLLPIEITPGRYQIHDFTRLEYQDGLRRVLVALGVDEDAIIETAPQTLDPLEVAEQASSVQDTEWQVEPVETDSQPEALEILPDEPTAAPPEDIAADTVPPDEIAEPQTHEAVVIVEEVDDETDYDDSPVAEAETSDLSERIHEDQFVAHEDFAADTPTSDEILVSDTSVEEIDDETPEELAFADVASVSYQEPHTSEVPADDDAKVNEEHAPVSERTTNPVLSWIRDNPRLLGVAALLVISAITIAVAYIFSRESSLHDKWGDPIVREFNGVEMVQVPAGCFMMGSDDGNSDERPVHEQCFEEPFWIDRTEVTRAMYQQCVDAGVCSETPDSDYSSQANQPINRVTWYQADEYCGWREARLPTEREWEYAARGPDSLIYPWGNEFEADNVVYSGNSSETAPVGSRPGGVSWVGAYDMSGNVWEWVSSWYTDYPYKSDDGREGDSGYNYRVLRGGSFNNYGNIVRAPYRYRLYPDYEGDVNGFRCARSE